MTRNLYEKELHSWKVTHADLIQRFKIACNRALEEYGVSKNQVALVCSVHPSTVTRWLDLQDDATFPACLIPALASHPETQSLARVIIESVSLQVKIGVILNADLTDETLEITANVGRLADRMKEGHVDPLKCERLFRDLVVVAERGVAECKQLIEARA